MERAVPITASFLPSILQNRKEDHQLNLLNDPLYFVVIEKSLFFSSCLLE